MKTTFHCELVFIFLFLKNICQELRRNARELVMYKFRPKQNTHTHRIRCLNMFGVRLQTSRLRKQVMISPCRIFSFSCGLTGVGLYRLYP